MKIEKSEYVVLTQNIIKIEGEYYLKIPKEIVDIMELDDKSLLESILSKVENKDKEFQ